MVSLSFIVICRTATTACTKLSVIFSSLVSVISCGGDHMVSDSLLICKNTNSDDIM